MKPFNPILRRAVRSFAGDGEKVALLLSGGIDSVSVAFALEEESIPFKAYTFKMAGIQSEDFDRSRKLCSDRGWECEAIEISVDDTTLKRDFLTLIRKFGCDSKIRIETSFPFLHVVPKISETIILSGVGADEYFGISKEEMIHYRFPRETFDAYRRQSLGSGTSTGLLPGGKAICESLGKVWAAPYLVPEVSEHFLRYGWEELNKPKFKQPIIDAFPEQFARYGYQKRRNLQTESGTSSEFERLLRTSLNVKKRTRILDLVKDYAI